MGGKDGMEFSVLAQGKPVVRYILHHRVPVFIAATTCVILTFSVRVLAVLFNWSLPEQRAITTVPRIRRTPRGDSPKA